MKFLKVGGKMGIFSCQYCGRVWGLSDEGFEEYKNHNCCNDEVKKRFDELKKKKANIAIDYTTSENILNI